MGSRKTTLKVLAGVAVAVLLIGVVTYLNRASRSNMGLVNEVERAQKPVQIAVVQSATLTETIERTGVLEAQQDVVLTAEVAGKVRQVHRDLGDRCKKGEPLFQLDASSYRIAWLQASAARKQAQAALEQAEREHERTAKLHAQGVATDQALDLSKSAVDAARAVAEQAQAGLSMAQRNLQETTIRCPFEGAVAQRMVDVGQMVGPQTPLARLVDARQLELTVTVGAAELSRLEVGQKVELSDASLASLRYQGVVARLGVAADHLTRTFPVEVLVPGGGDGPRPGQVVRARIEIAVHADVLAVPEEALRATGAQAAVFVAVDGKALKAEVQTGARIDGRVVIAQGIAAGDRVVVVGHDGLEPGDAVVTVGEERSGSASAAPDVPGSAVSEASATQP